MCAVTLRDPEIRQKILDAARCLIIENGVNNTSLADIARAAGISKGTLFYYYTTKSDLIFEVTDQHFKQLTSNLSNWVEEASAEINPEQILIHVYHTVVEDELRGKLHHYLIEQAIAGNGDLKNRFLEKYQEWIQITCEGLEHIIPSSANREILAQLITSSIDGLIIQSILGSKDVHIDSIATYLAQTLPAKPAA